MELAVLVGLCALFLALTVFFAVASGAYFGLDRVARARLEHEADESPDADGILLLLRSPRALRGTLNLLGDACRVGFAVTAVNLFARLVGEETGGPAARPWTIAAGVFGLLFFVGELAPRMVGVRHALPVVRFLSRPLRLLLSWTRPARTLAARIAPKTAATPRAVAAQEVPDGIDEEEFRELVDESTEAGVVQAQEQALIHKILDFGDRRVRDVMTPFDRIFSVADDAPVMDVAGRAAERKYSRIPVYRRDPRKIVGVLYAKDLLTIRWGVAQPKPLKVLLRRPLYVVPQMRAQALLESFKRHRLHMGIVVDEQGRAVGLCTMEDLLEELVGPITDVAAERKGDEAPT